MQELHHPTGRDNMELKCSFLFIAPGAAYKTGVKWRKTTQKHSCVRFLLYMSRKFSTPHLCFTWSFYPLLAEEFLLYWNGQKPEKNLWPPKPIELKVISDFLKQPHTLKTSAYAFQRVLKFKMFENLSLGLWTFRDSKKKSESRGGQYHQRGIVALPKGNSEIRGQHLYHLYHLLSLFLCESHYGIWTAFSFTLTWASRRKVALQVSNA